LQYSLFSFDSSLTSIHKKSRRMVATIRILNSSSISPETTSTGLDSAEQYVEGKGGEIAKQDGRVVVRLRGSADVNGLSFPYNLIPSQGVLAKSGKWRNMPPADQLNLACERASDAVVQELNSKVSAFVADFISHARANEVDPQPFLIALSDRASSDPAEFVFRAIEQRLANAVEKQQETKRAQRTRDSINLGEYPESFELARRLPRKFIALLGPTNSAKTHEAMQALAQAKSGVYLAPLRLLALENYERLVDELGPRGGKVSLITGEERRLQESATHVASTVEMLDTRTRIDVAVIDEIQMLADRERGSAWTAAVCGAPAKIVFLVGALEARPAIEALAKRLDVPLEIRVKSRKGPLEAEPSAVAKIRNLKKGDAVIAFSRRDVLMWRDLATEAGLSVSTVYGNLSPEVRRAQAERFREGKTDVVVGTDAIAMGLNLPIERVVFTTASKFNGVDEEELPAALAKQIAGRAGRFGIHEAGYFAGFDCETHAVVKALLKEKIDVLPSRGFYVAPTLEHLYKILNATNEKGLTRLLKLFARNVDTADGFFVPRITEEQLERSTWLDTLPLSLEDKFTLSLVPFSSRVETLNHAWQKWALNLSRQRISLLEVQPDKYRQSLQDVEDLCKLYSAYAWLAYRRPEYFPSVDSALEAAREASGLVDRILASQNRAQRARKIDTRSKRPKSQRVEAG
jgi:ATP-dependent RNA helicase SUPV3L1/SUV3